MRGNLPPQRPLDSEDFEVEKIDFGIRAGGFEVAGADFESQRRDLLFGCFDEDATNFGRIAEVDIDVQRGEKHRN